MEEARNSAKESLTVLWVQRFQLAVQVRDHQLLSDQPVEEGGQDKGITPVEMFLASLGTCMGYFAIRFLRRHQISVSEMRIHLEWDYAKKPHRIGFISVRVDLPGEWEPSLKERLLKVLEGCTVHQSLR